MVEPVHGRKQIEQKGNEYRGGGQAGTYRQRDVAANYAAKTNLVDSSMLGHFYPCYLMRKKRGSTE
jgi:hypothetical protein